MNLKATEPADLLQLLDLEEQQTLANKLGLSPPVSLGDKGFVDSIAQLSSTTVLGTILRLRRPFLRMLQEINAFLQPQGLRGRTTTRTVILPGETETELRLIFDQGLQEAIATFLATRGVDKTLETLDDEVGAGCRAVTILVNKVKGSFVWSMTDVSRHMRLDPRLKSVARNFDRSRYVYHPRDLEKVRQLLQNATALSRDLENPAVRPQEARWLSSGRVTFSRRHVDAMSRALIAKSRDMEAFHSRSGDQWEPRAEIKERDFVEFMETLRRLRERVLEACDFEEIAERA